ncbi:MAG: restriction endonuclease subunit S [Clostridiaceae bacterium]
MTPQELKNSILQLAIQGKLVEQRPEEGTAKELYQQIQTEKHQLIKVGTIKEEAALPDISEDEIPFDIPDSWKWVRLGDCSSYSQRKEKVNAGAITDDMWSLDLEDIEKDTGRIINKCQAAERKIAGDKVQFRKGQILYSKLRPYLKKVLVAPGDGICSSEMVPFVVYGNIDAQYLVYVLVSPHVDYVINSVTYGVKMPRVGTETMVNLLIPLPPLSEQKRIIAKIKELLPYIDRYEQAWSKLEDFNKRFPGDMQKSILQMAIQGKLVEQRPEEGTGEELYQQIQAEKQKIIKAGTIKKEKPLLEITEDEKPFDIPERWKWVRLGDLANKFTDGTHSTPKYTETGVPFISVKDMSSGKLDFSYTKHISKAEHDTLFKRCNPEYGDLLISKVGTTGVPAIVNTEMPFSLFVSVALMKFSHDLIDVQYLYYMVFSPLVEKQAKENTRGVGNKNWVLDKIRNSIVTLPPLAEQKRIVARLEEILPLCEKLK